MNVMAAVCVLLLNGSIVKEEFLSRMYGDYMKLPPKEKQKDYVPYILEFGEFNDMKLE